MIILNKAHAKKFTKYEILPNKYMLCMCVCMNKSEEIKLHYYYCHPMQKKLSVYMKLTTIDKSIQL